MKRTQQFYRRIAGGICLLMFCLAAHAQLRELKIPGGELKAALDAYAQQTGIQLLYKIDDVRNRSSQGVSGSLQAADALDAILQGTTLKARRDGQNAVVIVPGAPQASSIDGAAQPEQQMVQVTGSRLKSAELVSDSALVVVGSREIELQGTTNIENMLNNLPQLTASQSASQSTFGTSGTATLNLRNLGPQRTMVLVDGRRLMPGDPVFPYPDVNFIPAGLVESVDVVSGGASAAYGSDAVAGVVNFRMKRDFDGIKFDYLGTGAQHDNHDAAAQRALTAYGLPVPGSRFDGASHTLSLIAGRNSADGNGNLTVYASAVRTEPVNGGSRDWAACGIGTNSVNAPNDTHLCQGSSNSAFGRLRTNGSGAGLANNPDGSASFVPYNSATMGYNSNQLTYLQRSDERVSGGLFAHYQVSPALDLYTDLMLMRDRTQVQISPSGVTNNRSYSINCDNPLLSAAQATALCGANAGSPTALWKGTIGYRFADGGSARQDDLEHRDSRLVVGARGEWNAHWGYDIYGQYAQVDYSDQYDNDVSISRTQNALLVKNVNGVPACQSGAPGCVPLNIFQLGKAAASYPYLYEPSRTEGSVRQKIASATLHGDLGGIGLRSPWAATAAALAVGAEWRQESIALDYSAALLAGDLSGAGARQPASGSTSVKEAFGEVNLPLVDNRAWVKSLRLSAAYRLSDYDLAGVNRTYKLGLVYAPADAVSLRIGYNRAVRAPNIVELFAPRLIGSAGGNDPCSGANPAASLDKCRNSGVTPAQYGKIADCSSGFCNAMVGGNTGLKPESADTYTAGLVFTPTGMRNFSATVDYFNIKVKDMIGTVASSLILSECLNNNNPYYCGLIHRNAAGGIASDDGYVVGANQNTGFQHVAGIDLGLHYRVNAADLGLGENGRFNLAFMGTWLQYQKNQAAPGQAAYDCAGLYGPTCGVPNPKWRHNLRLSWDSPWDALLSLNWRYIAKTGLDANTGNALLAAAGGGKYNGADSHIAVYNYFDLAGSVAVRQNVKLRFGINNLFDKDPPVLDNYNFPIITSVGNGNTYSGLYSTLGRSVYLGLGVEFR